MTYGEFKIELESEMFADTKMPEKDEILIPLVMRAMRYIAYRTKPLTLLVKIPDFKIIRSLGNGWYLREPALIINENSKLDIDKELIDAVVYRVASKISIRNRESYEKEALEIMTDFNFKILEAEENANGEY